ncbi:MAG: hypothetical protein HY685_02040 [Chloroflexi bacterium]|nr:hypothetical protein [Chloroflexota bacterium]
MKRAKAKTTKGSAPSRDAARARSRSDGSKPASLWARVPIGVYLVVITSVFLAVLVFLVYLGNRPVS